ncbi:MAG: ribosomal RNA small subunit methyltransferase E [Gemmatales bacterium]|nr:MAG: ribosomal RNA small subunit methyltransferase E [Gemmatales bacterium]
MSERFYLNCSLAAGRVVLQGAEAHHLATVCRVRAGQQVYLFNGDGCQYQAAVVAVARRTVELDILARQEVNRELPFQLVMAAPLPKGDRTRFLVEKLTELGVSCFVPLRTRRSVVEPSDSRCDKLERYVIEASKQCGRNVLMRIEKPVDWLDWCRRPGLPERRILAQPGAPPLAWTAGTDVACAVGPEGGFTEDERDAARAAGWQCIGLGERILRVETAAILLACRAQ